MYRIPNVCPLERLIEYGVFSLKTNCCISKESFPYQSFSEEIEEDDEKMDSRGRFMNTSPGNVLMMTALRILQHGISRRSQCLDSKSVNYSPSLFFFFLLFLT